jgi:hypothetical protein
MGIIMACGFQVMKRNVAYMQYNKGASIAHLCSLDPQSAQVMLRI